MKFIFTFLLFSLSLNSFAEAKKTLPVKEEAATEKAVDEETPAEKPQKQSPPAFLAHGIGLGIGQTLLFGDYSDHGDDKLALDLFYQYRASYSFDFLANLHTSTYKKGDGQKTDLTGITTDIKGRLFDFDAFAPYLAGGLGVYWPRVTRYVGSNLLESERHLVLGVNIGLGADLQLNENFSFGLATFYHQPFSVKQDSQSSVNGSFMRFMATAFMYF